MIKLINAELIGWILSIIGTVVWVYGYFFSSGTPALVDWAAITPLCSVVRLMRSSSRAAICSRIRVSIGAQS